MKKLNSIKDLNVSIEDLYSNKKQLRIKLGDLEHEFSVILLDLRNKIDCKISSFSANIWFRTNLGLSYEKYKTLGSLESALIRTINTKLITDGPISFSISDTIDYL